MRITQQYSAKHGSIPYTAFSRNSAQKIEDELKFKSRTVQDAAGRTARANGAICPQGHRSKGVRPPRACRRRQGSQGLHAHCVFLFSRPRSAGQSRDFGSRPILSGYGRAGARLLTSSAAENSGPHVHFRGLYRNGSRLRPRMARVVNVVSKRFRALGYVHRLSEFCNRAIRKVGQERPQGRHHTEPGIGCKRRTSNASGRVHDHPDEAHEAEPEPSQKLPGSKHRASSGLNSSHNVYAGLV